MNKYTTVAAILSGLLLGAPACHSQVTIVTGKIIATQGHTAPACRMVTFRQSGTGTIRVFRIEAAAVDNGVLAVTLTALTTGLTVDVAYDPAVTSGCGTEPRIAHITINAP